METLASTTDQPPVAPLPAGNTETQPVDQTRLSNYGVFDTQFQQMIKDWDHEFIRTREQRIFRYIEVDVEKLRAQKFLKDDETIVPIRVADRNIRREQPAFVAFVTQSRRSLIFRERQSDLENAQGASDEQRLEEAFTQGMRYPGWELPIHGATDGAQAHGWDSVEVVYDQNRPLHVGIEHIGHDKLLFPVEAIDTEFCEYLARGYDLTVQQLQSFVKDYGFVADQVNKLIQPDSGTGRRTIRHYRVWKILFREDGIIKVAWRCDAATNTTARSSGNCDGWLCEPKPLFLGRQQIVMREQPPIEQITIDPVTQTPTVVLVPQPPVEVVEDIPETQFPIYLLRYHQTEDQQIFSTRGRVFLDNYDQEAQTAIASGFVNKLIRSTNVYAAVENDTSPGSAAAPKQLPVSLQHGHVYDKPLKFFSSDAPDPLLLNALQWFGVRNADENGQTDFAVNNRQDSRKTATEIQAASQQASLLSGVQVTIYSTWICSIYRRAWEIVQNLAINNQISFLAVRNPDGTGGQNDVTVIARDYYVRAAGDIDVTQRAEQVQRMMQFWPIVANTGAALPFLRAMMMTAFPNGGSQWVAAIQDDMRVKQLLTQVWQMFEQLVMSRPEELQSLPPEQQQQLMQMRELVAQTVAAPTGGNQ
jgi:hypothetical protein